MLSNEAGSEQGRLQGLQGHKEKSYSHSQNSDESGYQTGRPPDQHAGSVVLKVLCIWVIAPAAAPGCTITLLMLHSDNPRWPLFESTAVSDSPPHAL